MRPHRGRRGAHARRVQGRVDRLAVPPVGRGRRRRPLGLGAALNHERWLNGERNIHVSTILPYASDTPWHQHAANYSGHELGAILMDPPEKVIDAIVRATVAPKPEVAVGYKAKAIAASHRLGRRLTETIAGGITHGVLTDGAPAAPTAGNLHEPMPEGTGIRRDR